MTTHHKPREEKKGLTAFWDYLRGKARPVLEVCDPALKVCTAPFSLHWEKKYKQRFPQHAHKLLVLDLVLLTIVAALITGGIFSEQVLPHGQSTSVVRLDLEAPETVISGSPVDLRFSYTNDAVAPVGCVQLRVHLPQDTVITGPLPSLESAGADLACAVDASLSDLAAEEARHEVLVFPQSDLGPAESDGVTVRTTLYGATDEPRTLWAELSYWEAGKTVPTRVSLRREWKIAGSVFAFDVVAPSVARGRSHPVTVRYANVGDAVLRGARVTIEPPADFTVTDGAVERSVGDLSPGEEGSLTISGYFRSLAADGVAPTFTVRGTALAAGERTLVGLHRENTDPRASDLAFSLEITQPAGRQTLLAGETVRATVHYRNEGDRPLRDLMVRVDPGAAFYDAVSGPFLWDGKTDPALMETFISICTAGVKGS